MANSYDILGPRLQQNQIVNWGSCTAEEILEYEEQGQDVPEEYLRWAEEMSASMNAQDDVTYEMAQAENGNGGSAADFRQQMQDDGISLKQQGRIFIEESRNKEEFTLQAIEQMAPLLNVSQELSEEATQIADTTKTQLEVLKAEIEALAADKDDQAGLFKNRAERGEIQGLEAVAKALGTQASNQLQGIDAEIEEVDKIINSGAGSSQLSVDYGAETVKIGTELVGKSSNAGKIIGGVLAFATGGFAGLLGDIFGGLFGSSKKKIGKEAIEQGTQTMTVGNQGNQIAQQAADIHGVTIKSAEKAEQDLKSAENDSSTGGEENNTPTTTDIDTTSSEQKSEKDMQAELDPTLADTSITTDPNEILKRKERKGLA